MTGVDVEHTKATPGPWEVITVNGQLAVANTETKFLVAVLHPDDTDTVGPANAALMASAPALVAAVERVQAIAEHWSTCPKGDYDCHDCNYNRPEAGDLLLEALKLETP
ncbi:hypothetical protein ACFVWF_32170 [Rhodococcus qingshengii]|uniref:hypothetical protein n=1 Tax=Rhodococcus qingshengii TaxID=334542 RepID=UPI0036DCBB94